MCQRVIQEELIIHDFYKRFGTPAKSENCINSFYDLENITRNFAGNLRRLKVLRCDEKNLVGHIFPMGGSNLALFLQVGPSIGLTGKLCQLIFLPLPLSSPKDCHKTLYNGFILS
jgi:hypothetical protein